MTELVDKYTYRISWSEQDKGFVGFCVEFRELSCLATSAAVALKEIRLLVRERIEGLVALGEQAPEPLAARQFSGRFLVRVPATVHRQLVMEAAEQGVSLNRIVSAKLSR